MLKTVLLKQIKDNPFRDKKRNPIDQEKVESIAESIETTQEFWRGVYGREIEGDYVEIAFGHHRVDAARLVKLGAIPIEIEKFSDGDMLMWMARENVQGSMPVMMEALSAAVRALAEGKITLPALDPKTKHEYIRIAPSFIAGVSGPTVGPHPYTLESLTTFLGGNYTKRSTGKAKNSAVAAMARLEAEERGWLKNIKNAELDNMDVMSTIKTIGDIARVEKTKEKSIKEVRDAENKAITEQRKLEVEAKERAKKLEAERQDSLKKEAAARMEENKREVAKQKQKQKDLEDRVQEKKVIDSIKIAAIEAKVEETKQKAEQAKKDSERAPIIREQAALLVLINALESFQDRVRAHFRKNLTTDEREIMRQALMSRGERSFDLSRAGLPPLTAKQWSQLYQEREKSKRKVDAAAAAKKETKKKK